MPTLTLLGGPNGAGKSTLASRLFVGNTEVPFLNADIMARALRPSDPEAASVEAGRRLLRLRDRLIAAGSGMTIETTLASRGHLQALRRASASRLSTHLVFVWITNVEICLERVAHRVMQGGHHVPTDVVIRRFALGRCYLSDYLAVVDDADILDGSITPRPVASKRLGEFVVHDSDRWRIVEASLSAARQS